jgi:acyl transferase domain-containing protein
MNHTPEDLEALSPLKRALLALTDMQARLDAETRARSEPIAVIGLGCRFPGGAGTPQAYWRMLRDGVDGISEVPPDRWDIDAYYDADPAAPGKMSTRWGGFLERVDQFDADFFGISPREALWMDPQQRLLLEVAWEALEHAGQTASSWSGRPAGVFIGVSSSDYVWHQLSASGQLDAYTSTGNSYSIVANRLSYLLDLKGPSLVVDTACSSSLVAVHLACQSLRNQESHLALAGGVNLVLSPMGTISLSKYGMMAPDGRCKTFDARADGFVRGEGCGLVVLKRLSDALAAKDPVLALIRGSAVNQDGRSNGLTAPNVRSQQAVIGQALAQAAVSCHAVGYIETHGTGTAMGDPIETEALKAVLGPQQDGRECVIGSVKANIGHLEAAAGIAGLIKVVLALQHEAIPPQIHFRTLNPHIDLTHTPLVIAAGGRRWRREAGPRIAGVSSFGFGGTNAHAVLEEAPEQSRPREVPISNSRAYLLPLSARSPHALTALARACRDSLHGTRALHDFCYTASVRRNHHGHRLTVLGRSTAELAERLNDLARQEAPRTAGLLGPVFVFGGQGEQWAGMGRELLAEEPVFRESLEECEALLADCVTWSLTEELLAEESRSRLTETEIAQPVLLGLQVGLARLWRSWGLEPSAVVGHSVGEIAAAHIAGVLSLAEAVKVAVNRGRLIQRAHGSGAMLAVELGAEETARALHDEAGDVAIAAINGPAATVLSGQFAALAAIAESFRQRGIPCHELRVPYAFHHPQLAPIGAELQQATQGLHPQPAAIPMVSTLTGRSCEGGALGSSYWGKQLREPVRFADAVSLLAGQGHAVFLELSPHPVLGQAITQCVAEQGRNGVALASLRRNRPEREGMLTSLGRLYELGYSVAWPRLYPNGGRCVSLPTYPWQRKRFWPDQSGASARAVRKRVHAHPMLAEYLQAANSGAHCWQTDLARDEVPYLNDHRIQGAMVLPAAACVEMALAAASESLGPGPHALEQIAFRKALFLAEGTRQTVQLVLTAEGSHAQFQLLSRQGSEWTLHATGTIGRGTDGSPHGSIQHIRARCVESINVTEYYEALRTQGLEYGPAFRGVQEVWRRDGEALGRLQLQASLAPDSSTYRVHPALLDAGFQVLAAAVPRARAEAMAGDIYLPVKLSNIQIRARPQPGATLWSHVVARVDPESSPDAFEGDLFLMDEEGQVMVEALGLRVERLAPARSAGNDQLSDWLYKVQWQPKKLARTEPSARRSGSWLVLADDSGVGKAVGSLLASRGEQQVIVSADEFRPARPEDLVRLLHETFGDTPPRGVIHLWSLDAAPTEVMTLDSLDAGQELGCGSVLHLVQALAQTNWRQPPRLWLITRCARPVAAAMSGHTDLLQGQKDSTGAAHLNVSQSSLSGLARVIALEHPELHCTEVDLGPGVSPDEIASLVDELFEDDDESVLALRGETRYAARLARWSPEPGAGEHDTHSTAGLAGLAETSRSNHSAAPVSARTLVRAEDHPFRLESDEPGLLDRLCLRATTRRPPGPGEVVIRMAAAALNFNDVLKALGLYPDLPPGAVPLGSECAGTVVALGSGVEGLTVGQDVVALAEGSFGAYVTTPAPMVAQKPQALTWEEAASLPVVFMTAVYALRHLGRLASGDRVLIHAAAGGVGLAAIQVAQRVGAEIFATAGSPEKRAFLESLGVRHVMDSRSLAFAAEVMARTGGRGVDVILNSLAGDAMVKSLDLMAPYGRFLELGKRDLYENRRVGLWPFRKGVSYVPVDLAGLVRARPAEFNGLWREVMQDISEGIWKPLPRQVFPISEAADAFRAMAQGQHIGKIVLSMGDSSAVLIAPAAEAAISFSAARTYLITGGLGALGLRVAQWMVERGARHLMLVGRRNASEDARAVLASLEQAGAQVVVVPADVSSPGHMARALAGIDRDVPLSGIIHAAGVIDDGLLLQQDWKRFVGVMAPKVKGAWNLHSLTQNLPLDFFVMFSSMASVVGSPGQGSYAAANAFMDGLAGYRRARGLPALSVNWGPWGEVGMAAGQRGVSKQIRLMGGKPIAPLAGLQLLERLLPQQAAQIGVLPVSWREFPAGAAMPSLLADLIREEAPGHSDRRETEGGKLRESLFAAAEDARQPMLEGYLSQQLARVLGSSSADLDLDRPLSDLGIDSLMAVELRARIQSDLRVTMPLASVLAGPSLRQTTTLLLEQLTTRWLVQAPRGNDAESEWEVLRI